MGTSRGRYSCALALADPVTSAKQGSDTSIDKLAKQIGAFAVPMQAVVTQMGNQGQRTAAQQVVENRRVITASVRSKLAAQALEKEHPTALLLHRNNRYKFYQF